MVLAGDLVQRRFDAGPGWKVDFLVLSFQCEQGDCDGDDVSLNLDPRIVPMRRNCPYFANLIPEWRLG